MTDCINLSRLLNFPWTDLGWFIYQLEVRIWFWSSAAWPPTLYYLSLSTMYSRSLWRTNTIVFSVLNKPLSPLPPPQGGLIEDLWYLAILPPQHIYTEADHHCSWETSPHTAGNRLVIFHHLHSILSFSQSTCTVNYALLQTLPICSLSFANRNWNLITFGRKNLQKRTLKYNNCEFVNVWQNSKNKNCAEITD